MPIIEGDTETSSFRKHDKESDEVLKHRVSLAWDRDYGNGEGDQAARGVAYNRKATAEKFNVMCARIFVEPVHRRLADGGPVPMRLPVAQDYGCTRACLVESA
jgi:hypothetical protein